jgi:L-asparaginase II
MASKVEDGNNRATPPFVVDELCRRGYVSEQEARALEHHRRPSVTNHAGVVVGLIQRAG